jgi:hypothetical protein
MVTHTAPTVTALQAQAVANLFLSDHLPDRFTADHASLNPSDDAWHVPVILAYPVVGAVGQVGEILISAAALEVISYTPFEAMQQAAEKLYTAHRDAIEAAFS